MKRLENKFINITENDLRQVHAPLLSNNISGASEEVQKFEAHLAHMYGHKYAISVNSGTVAIYAALHALGIGEGDEVIIPATAIIMCALPVTFLGATIVFSDVVKNFTLEIDIEHLKKIITPNTKAIMTVPLWGYPIPMGNLRSFCKENNLHLIEDIAQAHGTKWNGQLLGTFGDMACMSTHERKLITTGEGGAILTSNDELAQSIHTLKNTGLHDKGRGFYPGLNFRIPATSAALGITQILKIDAKIIQRKTVASQLKSMISEIEWLQEIPFNDQGSPNYYCLVLRVDRSINIQDLELHLENHGVISDTLRYNYKALYHYPLFQTNNICPNAEYFIKHTITLPCHEGMNLCDLNQIKKALFTYNYKNFQ